MSSLTCKWGPHWKKLPGKILNGDQSKNQEKFSPWKKIVEKKSQRGYQGKNDPPVEF